MGDPQYPYPVSLQWGDGPQRLKKSKNKLLLYFQKRSESNGGECEIRDTDCSRGYILIHFKEEEARDRVLQKGRHLLKLPNGEEVQLNLSLPNTESPDTPEGTPGSAIGSQSGRAEDKPTPEDEVSPSSLVLIENLKDSDALEMLNLLVENTSEKVPDMDFYVEIIPDIQSAVVTFTCDIDIQRFIRTFSSNLRVAHNKLTARPLEESRSVRVENVPENTSEMHLAAFFENPRQGGGRVEDIVMVPEERAALITFQDTADVKRVLKKDHVFSKKKISVYPYFPLLSIALYGKDRPCIEIPKPIEFNISPYILEHICNNEGLKNNIDVKMKDKHCEIKWPDQDCQDPVLHLVFPPTLSTHLRSVVKIVPKWKENVYNEFSLFISKFRVIEYKMDESVWETIREHVSSSTYDGVLIKPDFGLEKVSLAGMSKDVTKIDPTFRQLVEETTKQVERKKQTKTDTISMSSALYQIMCNSGQKKKILDQVPELKMDYDVPRKTICLSGLREEVLTAKCEILDIKQQMKSKPFQMNPHLVQFLISTDNEELSSLLFVRHNINAMVEIDDGVVKLMAHSKEDLIEAENQIKENLDHRQLLVEDKSLLKSPKWRSLHSQLLQVFNAEKITVLIEESSEMEDNMVIAGLTSNVLKCYQQVSDFLEKNTTIETRVAVQPSAKMTFLIEERKEMLEKIKKNVNVTKNQNSICLSGPRVKVQEEVNVIGDILHSLHSDILRIGKPGAKKFCKANEKVHATMARTIFNCVIRLEEAGVEDNLSSKSRFQISFPNGMTLSVYKDDLCRHNVDVIVNAANEDLKHGGGLAKAILDAAGRKLQDDCDQIIRKDGRLSTGDSVITDAGKLPCKQIIHTVGPRWDANSSSRCERLLRKAITTSLQLASEKSHSSIAIPAVSSGIFGFPLELCIENIVEAIRDYVEMAGQQSTLQRIHLVDMNDESVNIFSEVTKAKFGNQPSDVTSKAMAPQPVTRAAQNPPVPVNRSNANTVRTKEGLKIKLLQKNIEDCSTDVIVNSVGADLNLNAGAVSKALLSRAGSNMQQLLNDASLGTQGEPGSVFSTDGCNLNCQEVLHVVTPQWDNGQGTSEKILRKIIKDCLALAEQNQWMSISFPAFGTGILGFPKDLVAFVMFNDIFQFSCKNKVQNLQEVHLVLHPSDRETIKAFTSQLENCTDSAASGATNRQSAGAGSTFFGTVTDPSLGVHEMKIGSITFQVKTGDITKEKTDVIVNSSNQNFTLCTGVSKAILEAAGPSVVSSAAALGAQSNNGYIITDSGNITQCEWILHVVGRRDPASIKIIVLDVLQECEKRQVSSVTFPALGTGAGGLAASTVADSILDGLVDFIKSKSVRSLQTVKVVLFQQPMLNDFYMSMKTREGTALPEAKSLLTRIFEYIIPPKASKRVQKLTPFQLMDGIEPVVFSLCAEDKRNVDKTKDWLQQLIDSEQGEKVITEECISELDEAEVQKISDLQKKFQVSVIYKPPDPSIRIVGLTRDVLPVSGEIETIINRVKDRKNRERAAELTGKLVEWSYDNRGTMVPFDKMTNLELEEAKNDNKIQITIQIQGHQYTVRVQGEKATDKHGNQIQIQRVVKHEGDTHRLPPHWKPMGKTLVMEVDVAQGTPEYSAAEQKFQKSCGNTILKILRVQNRDLWLNYQIKKQNIDSKNASTTNEKELFHGTDSNSILHVNHNGFNRSYAGKNGTAYGNGTYFAVNANYSVGYASPDGNRQRHMYLARVLTGLYCVGNQTIITPPAKNAANPTDLYDSVTDNVQNPSMFVIFNDIQAYPEYHIIFQ